MDSKQQLQEIEEEISALQQRRREVIASAPRESVPDYTFSTEEGKVKLSELFGDADDLIVVHNMGRSCSYCTLWADGFNGVVQHLNDRAPFVVVSPDPPSVQKQFASSRGWTFRMVSCEGTDFAKDMGVEPEPGSYWPGISTFRKTGDGVERVAFTFLGPGDPFCSVWHIFDMLAEGAAGWQPKFDY